jgi:hypothetical protein
MNLKLVVARYQENLNWLEDLPYARLVYNKGEDLDLTCVKLPNFGRESNSYLRYIIDHYHEMDEHVAFLQGRPFDHCPTLLEDLANYSGELTLLGSRKVSDGLGRPDHGGLNVTEFAERIGLVPPSDEMYEFCVGAQFIVPRRYIHSKPLNWWKKLLELHDVETEPHRGELNKSPWLMERLWHYIFLLNKN